ncbi:MAG: hypothetical protein R2881_02395 [Eubacteriales bacterium]
MPNSARELSKISLSGFPAYENVQFTPDLDEHLVKQQLSCLLVKELLYA